MLTQTGTRLLLAPLGRLAFRPVVEGRDNVPRHGPVILAANHLSSIATTTCRPTDSNGPSASSPACSGRDARSGPGQVARLDRSAVPVAAALTRSDRPPPPAPDPSRASSAA
ncbi:hypothetical protein [Micromonospora schwarzwaldensis]